VLALLAAVMVLVIPKGDSLVDVVESPDPVLAPR